MTLAEQVATHEAASTVLPAISGPQISRETDHRVANSLQLLAAMVSVEARRIVDPVALAALDMTLRRIGAIASVHRHLYHSAAVSTVHLGTYIEELGADLERSFGDASGGRRIVVHTDAVTVLPEAATSLGIILTELVSNACKYAYLPGEPGDIRVELGAASLGGYQLEVTDRGNGIGTDRMPRGTGLGRILIDLMAKRLGAQHAWHDASPGTRFILRVARDRSPLRCAWPKD